MLPDFFSGSAYADYLPIIECRCCARKGRCCRKSSTLVSVKRSTQGPSIRPKALKVPRVPQVPQEKVLQVPQEKVVPL
jgi:hypothetical protein